MIIQTEERKREAEQVLTEYITENQRKLYQIAYSYSKERESALDIVQETVLKAYSKINSLRDIENIKPWIYRITINESISYIKNNKKIGQCFNIDDYEFEIEAKDKDFLRTMDIYQYIDYLKPKLKTVIILRFFEDMTLEEIADVTKLNINTVKTRLYTALKELRKNMREV